MIVTSASVTGFFDDAVKDAIRARGIDVTDAASRYIVGVLTDYARPDSRAEAALDKSLTLLLDEALNVMEPGERFERLRSLGDGVLYACGFFPDHFEARGVEQAYVMGIGSRAYDGAGSILKVGSSTSLEAQAEGIDIFGELAGKFAGVVALVRDVAEGCIARGTAGSAGVVKLYERWLRTGSSRLADALSEKGIAPMRATTGSN